MYAIVKSGGKQYRVERGQQLVVERLAAAEGETVALQPILYRSEEAVFDRAGLERVQVSAKVLAHERGDKLRVFKFKPKRGYKRRNGHRQELTRIEVTELSLNGGSPAKAKQAASAKPKPAKPAAAQPAQAKAESAQPAQAKAESAKPAQAKAESTKPAQAKGESAKPTAEAADERSKAAEEASSNGA
jgi:large subunit ribosomal protein L21